MTRTPASLPDLSSGRRAAVVIAGASFAGLAVARALRGHDVLLLDPHPPGAFETSAGALPLPVLEALGATDSGLETHHQLLLHTPRHTHRLPLDPPYAIADYARLCQALAQYSGARIRRGRALGYRRHVIDSDTGAINCLAAVDATGSSAVLASTLRSGFAPRHAMGAGLEIVIPRPGGFPNGLHAYLAHDLPPGYGWAFGAGATLRIGVGVLHAAAHAHQLDAALEAVLARAGLPPDPTILTRHGGLIPLRQRASVVDDLFAVGDAAGQAFPGTAEGIRPAFYFGTLLGTLLRDALEGRRSWQDARRAYAQLTLRHARRYRLLANLQSLLGFLPRALAWPLIDAGTATGLTTAALARYQRGYPCRSLAAPEPVVSRAQSARMPPDHRAWRAPPGAPPPPDPPAAA